MATGESASAHGAQGTVVYTARSVITMEDSAPRGTAVAVRAGRFVAVGSLDEVLAIAGGDATVDNRFDGKVLMPGLIDQHLHPVLAANTLTCEIIANEEWVLSHATFPAANTQEEYRDRLLQAHLALPEGEWLFSWGYHQLWHGELTRDVIDSICADRPVAVWHRTCHEWALNTAALERIGATREKFEGKGFMSEQADWVNGRFWENGNFALLSPMLMPVFATRERYRRGLDLMIEYLHMNGVTAINEPGINWGAEPWEVYQEVLGNPDVPFYSTFMVDGRSQSTKKIPDDKVIADAERGVARGTGDKVFLFDRQVKLFCDGAGIGLQMQMKDGYVDWEGRHNPDHHGEWILEPHELRRMFDIYWDAEWQIHIHVTGDEGVEVLAGILEDAQRRKPRIDHRTVFVHFMNSTPDQITRIAAQGAIVSINPYYVIGFGDKFTQFGLGGARADVMGRAGSVLRAGMPLSFHSDLPICPANPLLMVQWGATRVTQSGRTAGSDECVPVHDALRAVTIEAAYSWQREDSLGSIAPGKVANLTVLEEDPYAVDPTRLGSIRVLGTVFEGRHFPVANHLVERRVAGANGMHGMFAIEGSLGETPSQHTGCDELHACSCEVAEFMSRHMSRDGWVNDATGRVA